MVGVVFGTSAVLWAFVSAGAAVLAGITGIIVPIVTHNQTTKANKAGFYLEFTQRYNTPEMHDALLKLTLLHTELGASLPERFTSEFARGTELGRELDRARREVNRYFVNIAEMHTNGLIDRKLASMLCNFQGLNIFYTVVIPMNDAKYGKLTHTQRLYSKLRRIRPQYEDGTFGLRP
ncbi:hypothetical protein [Asticcacaulis machinosus]|uniref:Uncharacterized protein n=1 Tax=Asticcacaulis machinosus TaxID=2984211 RepID=A0ABT5HHT6_9CAUL|nr:hypothetical protein [Asticcacaulis machinosus]MDC7675159.1 hypothetical protein [Asticcacaulis machinosus]